MIHNVKCHECKFQRAPEWQQPCKKCEDNDKFEQIISEKNIDNGLYLRNY